MKEATMNYIFFVKAINEAGYVLNPYEPCVKNKSIENNQHTLTWHANDANDSHQ